MKRREEKGREKEKPCNQESRNGRNQEENDDRRGRY